MSKRGQYKYSIQGQPLYPHIKLTAEKFPRLLSTRIVDDTDRAEYFGPFLTRSAARILIDFLNTAFRLRSCTIPIDGTFNVPCTQYYAKRCVAPCVESLCGYDEYLELVDLAKSFLHNDRERFEARAYGLITRSSENLDFERAAFLRDTLENVRSFWSAKRSDVWIDDAVDTYLVERDAGVIKVFIVTTRRARMLGSRVFVFPASDHIDTGEVLAEVIYQFYRVHLPREIRVAFDFERRHEIAHLLADRLGRPVRTVVRGEKPEKVTAMLALARTKLDVELEKIKPVISLPALKRELKSRFGLRKTPARIEAFDAAHISGSFAVSHYQPELLGG
ncbi:MAG: UvrB/UvrC motif-containing protein, partial [Acidobacteriota bacterium]